MNELYTDSNGEPENPEMTRPLERENWFPPGWVPPPYPRPPRDPKDMEDDKNNNPLLAMVEALIDAIEAVSDLPEIVDNGPGTRGESRRAYISTNGSLYSVIREHGMADFKKLCGHEAELKLIEMLSRMLLGIAFVRHYHLRAMPDRSVMLKALALTQSYWEPHPVQGKNAVKWDK